MKTNKKKFERSKSLLLYQFSTGLNYIQIHVNFLLNRDIRTEQLQPILYKNNGGK